MKITAIDVASCPLVLERPFKLGGRECKSRDYVAIRISTDAGPEGYAIGYRSGTLLFETLVAIGPRLIGADPDMRREVLQIIEDGSVQGRAMYLRAASLVDIALWDITAKAAELPLYRMLGGSRRRIPAVPVAGFNYQHRSPESVEAELKGLLDAGYRTIKIVFRGGEPRDNIEYVTRMAAFCKGQGTLIVDAQWSWRHLRDALVICQAIDDIGLEAIEDPFLPQQWRLVGELRSRLSTPIAVGEDVLDLYGYRDLVEAVDILRVDATASGGITTVLGAFELAQAHGRRVFPHAFPYLHTHLACAHAAAWAVEFVPPETGTDPVRSLLRSFPAVVDGQFQVSEEPGVGIDLDWAAVTKCAAAVVNIPSSGSL